MVHCRKLCILCISVLFLLSCSSIAKATENDRSRMATKFLAFCYQAKMLYKDPDRFALLQSEDTYFFPLSGAVYGKERFGFVFDTSKKIYVVFRGSESYSDILRDFMILKTPFTYVPDGGNVHTGFFSIYNGTSEEQPVSLREQIIKILNTRYSKNKQLIITGFSLGGALATLCACDVVENTRFKDPIVYTFASPRVGDQQFVDAYNKRIKTNMRVVNYQDYVPCNPLHWLGYRHVKGEAVVNVNTGRIDKNHRMDAAYFPGLVANVPEYLKTKLMKKYADICPPLPKVLPDPSWEEKLEDPSQENEDMNEIEDDDTVCR